MINIYFCEKIIPTRNSSRNLRMSDGGNPCIAGSLLPLIRGSVTGPRPPMATMVFGIKTKLPRNSIRMTPIFLVRRIFGRRERTFVSNPDTNGKFSSQCAKVRIKMLRHWSLQYHCRDLCGYALGIYLNNLRSIDLLLDQTLTERFAQPPELLFLKCMPPLLAPYLLCFFKALIALDIFSL